MSIEREIVQRLQESRRLKEAWLPVFNKLSKYEKDVLRKKMLRLGIDIQNTPYKEIQITSGRDPRLKDKYVVVVFEFSDGSIGVWNGGQMIINPDVRIDRGVYKSASSLSWSTILANTIKITSYEFNEESANQLKAKQADRKASQQGTINRYTKQNKPKYAIIDKSGYIVNPDKYKDMLAKMKIDRGAEILQQAKDTYTKLANNIDKIDWDKEGYSFDSYDYIMRGILTTFADLTKALKQYEESKKSAKDDEAERYYVKAMSARVASYIKDMREYINKAKKYL